MRGMAIAGLILASGALAYVRASHGAPTPAAPSPVSFQRSIRPLLQQRCQGCHQPASAGGKLILTSFAAFKAGGEKGPAFVPGKPEESLAVQMVSGPEPKMPLGLPPLAPEQVGLLRRWVQEGATDDSVEAKDPIDADHPPVYATPPAISALAYSPDGKDLAVAGYREILLHHADGSGLEARLVGKSHQIETLAYSPDGTVLAAAGGSPGRFGEVQFWNPATRQSIHAINVSYDVLFGASFSPDGKEFAFGAPDNSVRAITVPDGGQILKFDNHSDWVFGTAFSKDGKHLISTGRDMAVKLVEVSSASFIDDINKHYDSLKALARHPTEDQVAVGGQDGIPRLYQVFRTVARTMNNEDHNLIQTFEKQPWPIQALAFSLDGSKLAVGGAGTEVRVYEVKTGQRLLALKGHTGGVFTLAFDPAGDALATGGFDGQVRLFEMPSGRLVKSFVPVPIREKINSSSATKSAKRSSTQRERL